MPKYLNKPTRIDGYYFPSKKESRRYLELYTLQRSGEIKDLKIHPKFEIDIGKFHITTYIADFSYWVGKYPHLKQIIEDVKGQKSGTPYELFKLKKKLMSAINDLEVTEI